MPVYVVGTGINDPLDFFTFTLILAQIKTLKQQWGGLKNSNRFSPNQVVYLLLTWMVARRPEVILRTIDDGSPGCLYAASKKLLHSQKCPLLYQHQFV